VSRGNHQSFARDWGTIFFSPKKEIEVTILGTCFTEVVFAPFVFLVLDFVTRREGREGREEGKRMEGKRKGRKGKEREGKGKGRGGKRMEGKRKGRKGRKGKGREREREGI
jgi:hypothetical protein